MGTVHQFPVPRNPPATAPAQELATRRYAAAAHESPTDRIVTPMMADLRTALRQVPTLAVGVLQDGAHGPPVAVEREPRSQQRRDLSDPCLGP